GDRSGEVLERSLSPQGKPPISDSVAVAARPHALRNTASRISGMAIETDPLRPPTTAIRRASPSVARGEVPMRYTVTFIYSAEQAAGGTRDKRDMQAMLGTGLRFRSWPP